MRTRMRKKALLPVAILTAALLAGCSGNGQGAEPAADPDPSATATVAAVSDQYLGEAMSRLVFHDEQSGSSGAGSCLVTAVRQAGVSHEGLAYIVETGGDHLGAVIEGLRGVNPDDAEAMLSPQLREDLDACLEAEVLSGDDADAATAPAYEAPEPGTPAETPVEEANLEPRFEIGAEELISSPPELRDGLVSMFVSYAQNEEQRQTYQAAGGCLAGVVLEADFSQETLRFLAGGAPIGTGEVADYLPNEEDKATWQSPEFTTALVRCTLSAMPEV